MSPKTTTAEERIGKYLVHPVAARFPRLEGKEYEDLKRSLLEHGQQQPIVLKDGVLIDGRNRLAILLELGKQPVTEEYAGMLAIEDYILTQNLWRRHLTGDQRVAITTQIMLAKETEAAKARRQEGGKKHGRGRPKVAANSTQPIRQPTVSEKIAEAAKTTDHQARQAVAVARHAPDLFEPVKNGSMKLKDAAIAARKPIAPPREKPGFMEIMRRIGHDVNRAMRDFPQRRAQVRKETMEYLDSWTQRGKEEHSQ